MASKLNIEPAQGDPPVVVVASAPAAGSAVQGELTLMDYAVILWKRKILVMTCALAGLVVALVAHHVLPKTYQATALVWLPHSDGVTTGALGKVAGLTDGLPTGMFGMKFNLERYVDMLGSDKALDEVANRLKLADRYPGAPPGDLRRMVAGSATFKITKGGLLSITASDSDPQTAARVANVFVESLDQLDSELTIGRASRERQFLEQRVTEAESELKTVQKACQEFQQRYRIITVDEGLKATATVMGELEAQRIAKEVELNVLSTVYAHGNPQVEILRAEVKQLDEKLKELSEKGVGGGRDPGQEQKWLFPSVDSVPALAIKQMDLERRLRLSGEVHRLLVTQLEMARINAARDRSAVQPIAPASVPDLPSGMRGRNKLLLGLIAGFVMGASLAGFLEKILPMVRRATPAGLSTC